MSEHRRKGECQPIYSDTPYISEYSEVSRYRSILSSRIGRIAAIGTLLAGAMAVEVGSESSALASSSVAHHVYRTDGDGVWLHNAPGLHTPLETLMPDGAEFDVECFAAGGDIVSGNGVWLEGEYNGQYGAVTDYYIDTHWKTTQDLKDQGIPACGEAATPASATPNTNIQPAAQVTPFINYNRATAVNWALAHAEDTPPDAGSCTWFVSQALVAGGVPQDSTWNTNKYRMTQNGVRDGTDTAWRTPDFLAYMKNEPYAEVEYLGQLKNGINNIPDARLGDVIIYDWDDNNKHDNTPDHADVVTGSAVNNSQYPLVSGWSEDGPKALTYNQRGWTWSELNNRWLQQETNHANMQAWLIHIRTEDDINVS